MNNAAFCALLLSINLTLMAAPENDLLKLIVNGERFQISVSLARQNPDGFFDFLLNAERASALATDDDGYLVIQKSKNLKEHAKFIAFLRRNSAHVSFVDKAPPPMYRPDYVDYLIRTLYSR